MESELEWRLTNSCKRELIDYLSSHPEDFGELVKLAITDSQPYSWRAAWLLWSVMSVNDHRLQGYIKAIIDTISARNDNQQRELLMILQRMDINEELEGVLFNHCASVWEKINKKPSVRLNAFKMIIKIGKRHPDLIREIELLTQVQYLESLSPAARKSISALIEKHF